MTDLILCFGFVVAFVCQPPAPSHTTTIVCPPVVEWSSSDQSAAAAELKKLPQGHPLRRMGVVAVKQRDIVRACQK